MAKKRIRKPRLHGKRREILPWRFWDDEQLLGRSKDLWPNAESLSPGPRTMQDAANGSMRAKAIIYSYSLVVPVIVMQAAEYQRACLDGGAGVAL